MSDELKDMVEKSNHAFEEFKKANDERIETIEKGLGVAELEAKLEKQTEVMVKSIESAQKEAAEAKKEAEELKALSISSKSVEGEEDAEVKSAVASFYREAQEGQSLVKFLQGKQLDLKAMSVGSDPNGGYLVLPTMGGVIKTREFETSPLRAVANIVTISTDEYVFQADNDESGANWVGELETRSATSTPTFDEIRIPVHELHAKPLVSQKLLDDAFVNVESWIGEKSADKFARSEATAFVSGDGVKKPRGFTTYDAWAGTTYESNAIQQVNSGTSGAVTADGLLDLQNSLKEAYQGAAVFMMKRATFGEVVKLKDQNDNYIVNRVFDMNAGVPFNILGRQVFFADDMDAVAADALAIAYGDFGRGYTIVDRIGIRVLRDPYTSYPQVAFQISKRVGGAVSNPEAIKLQKLAA